MLRPAEREPGYPIASVDNALRLLLRFRESKTLRVASAARALGVAPSTAHRLLQMLRYHGFVEQEPSTHEYRAGRALIDVGLSVVRGIDFRSAALPVMEAVCRDVRETINLAVLQAREVLFIGGIESDRLVRVSTRVGVTLPAHTTSSGKAMLAFLSDQELRSLYPRERLSGLTEASIRSRQRLFAELATVRESGYAVNRGESEIELVAVAVPILDRVGRPRAALAVSIPSPRFDEAQVAPLGARLRRAAGEIASSLA